MITVLFSMIIVHTFKNINDVRRMRGGTFVEASRTIQWRKLCDRVRIDVTWFTIEINSCVIVATCFKIWGIMIICYSFMDFFKTFFVRASFTITVSSSFVIPLRWVNEYCCEYAFFTISGHVESCNKESAVIIFFLGHLDSLLQWYRAWTR